MGWRPIWSLILCFVTLGMTGCAGERPARLGIVEGRLTPCPKTPNCVSSQAEDEAHRMNPIPFSGSATDAQAAIRSILQRMERMRIVDDEPGYIHAEARSRTFGFVDDVEFIFDESAGLIHFRSAARLGYGDLGVNRRRMDAIRQRFLAQEDHHDPRDGVTK